MRHHLLTSVYITLLCLAFHLPLAENSANADKNNWNEQVLLRYLQESKQQILDFQLMPNVSHYIYERLVVLLSNVMYVVPCLISILQRGSPWSLQDRKNYFLIFGIYILSLHLPGAQKAEAAHTKK